MGATCVVALAVAGIGAHPAGALGPGGWDHVGSPPLNGTVSALHAVSGSLYVGGAFTDAGGIGDADRIARWNGSSWSAVGPAAIPAGSVDAIATYGSKVFVGGTFQNAGGNANADFLAQWDGTTWSPFCNGPALTGNVTSLQVVASTLYVGGSFQNGAGIPTADYLLACDLVTGDSSSTVNDPAHPFSGPVDALTVDANGALYAGGAFSNLENLSAADNVAYRDGTGWHPLGAGGAVTGAVRSLAASGTTVYVGTDAKNVAGIPQADNVARWNGSSWSALGANIAGTDGWFPASTSVNGLAAFGSGLYATGTFQDASGDLLADNVAAFDGTAWHNVGSDGAGNGPWTGTGLALAVFDQSRPDLPVRLYAGGSFPSAGGESLAGRLATYQLTLLPPASTTPPLDTVAPQLRNVDLSVTRFRAARSGPSLGPTRSGVGTRVR
ncbi:MAG TPA: hypothetical protein VF423_06955, partial [Actinomycetes bacterium]